MPELPEVETMRSQLEKFLVGSVIKDIKVKTQNIVTGDYKKLLGQKVVSVRRFAKVSSIDFSNNFSLLTHVKLTGQFIYRGPKLNNDGKLSKKVVGGLGGPHTHVTFDFEDGGVLYYNDIRKFGWIRIMPTIDVENEKFVKTLGPEPFKDLNLEYFQKLLSKSKRNIKVLLMDQSKIGGVGNIYANDALWLSKISPQRSSNTLSDPEQKELYSAIHTVLKAGLKYGGASELAFVTPDGKEGEYQNHTLVYGHEKTLCDNPACRQAGVKIEKFFLGGRGTYWCPSCQK